MKRDMTIIPNTRKTIIDIMPLGRIDSVDLKSTHCHTNRDGIFRPRNHRLLTQAALALISGL